MGFAFLALLLLQIRYLEEMVDMKKEQFDESVYRSLYQVSRNMELNETLRYMELHITKEGKKDNEGSNKTPFELKVMKTKPSAIPKAVIVRNDQQIIRETSTSLQEKFKNQYIYQKALVDEVIYSILSSNLEKPLKKRINFKLLDQVLKAELMNNGISIPYHFIVTTQDGREIYRCSEYKNSGEEYVYSQMLFRNEQPSKTGIVHIHFPNMDRYLYSSIRFMIPAIVFTVILLLTFLFTIVVIFSQKRYSDIKNDFINNMTHELKTPISSISLAAQMLHDTSLSKSPAMLQNLGNIINDESKRLRYLIDKVLQISMFDRKKIVMKDKELDLNEMVEAISKTFKLRVEHTGGHIHLDLGAADPIIYVDEMHFQNVINNLIDNAVKYRKSDLPVNVYLKTWSDESHVYLSVRDIGLGIKRENLKKIFDKFYRVHTGNLHDVKGFGLGLAYVKSIVELQKGEILVESDYGKWTEFIIKLPIIKN